ncbi:hypothetical protein [Actinokineospora enzanensis]|uniref:hypothetical protein n=1 Tax=Actinokineospora enzanensis TaxID=155975 RepID=UPI00036D2388|nr:hypothetical protein [Actinokineospora enzanensis]
MTTPGYEINDPSSLSAHVGRVAHVSDMINEANTAGQQVGLGGVDAYGLLCSPLMIPALQMYAGNTDDLLKGAAELAAALSDGIKRTITDYDGVEQQLSTEYGRLEGTL